ncbi:MAG TPA: DNA-binding response regulator, partial [Anaeromyxobacter sp.]
MDPLRVIVVADDPLSRAGLAALLAGRADVAVAAEVRADDAPRAAAELGAAAAVWDLGPPGADLP